MARDRIQKASGYLIVASVNMALNTFVSPLMLLVLLLVCDLSAGLAARALSHADPHTLNPKPFLLPLPKPCQTDDLLGGLEQLAGPDVQGDHSAWEEWLQELKTWRTQVHRP